MRTGYRVAFYIVAIWMAIGITFRLILGGNLWLPTLLLVLASGREYGEHQVQDLGEGTKYTKADAQAIRDSCSSKLP
jgi:hypothetical protein